MNNTFIAVPRNVSDPEELRRFLATLIQQLDTAFGLRGTEKFVTEATVAASISALDGQTSSINTTVAGNALEITQNKTDIAQNKTDITTLNSNLNNPAISDLAMAAVAPSAAYVQAEAQQIATDVQTLQTNLNSILNRLRLAKIIV